MPYDDELIIPEGKVLIVPEEDEESHLIRTCDDDSGFDDPHDHEGK